MAHYDFTAQAVQDLIEIGRYTKQAWGLAQAQRYREELELALQRLSFNPSIGRARDELSPGLKSFRVASHIAFYLPKDGGLTVIRLLHPSRDIEQMFSSGEGESGNS